MTARAPYSRVYWSILDDEKFEGIVDQPALLGSWLLLLINADAIYPAPAFVPAAIRRSHLTKLVEVGLIDMTGAGTYRVHGLASERARRADASASGARARWGSERDASASGSHSVGDASRAKPSRAEQSQAEEADPAVTYHTLSGRMPSDRATKWLDELSAEYGSEAVSRTLAAVWEGDAKSRIQRCQDALKAAARKKAKPRYGVQPGSVGAELLAAWSKPEDAA